MKPRILAISESEKEPSFGQVFGGALTGARSAGAEVTQVYLTHFELPIYEGCWEVAHGLPYGARELQHLVSEHHGMLFLCHELNGGYTALLKNAIDWISRPDESRSHDRLALAGKIAALVPAGVGASASLRSEPGIQAILHRLGVLVVPPAFFLDWTTVDSFDRSEDSAKELARHIGATLVSVVHALAAEGVAAQIL